jgi:uncharacterized protein YcfJ
MLKKLLLIGMVSTTSLLSMEQYKEIEIPVLKQEKIEKEVVKRYPYEDCKYVVGKRDTRIGIQKVLEDNKNGIVGGAIGAGLTSGGAKVLTTIAGTLIGSKYDKKEVKPHENIITQKDETNHYKEECVTRYKQEIKKVVVGYKNIGKYEGMEVIKTTEEPLKKINLKLNIVY